MQNYVRWHPWRLSLLTIVSLLAMSGFLAASDAESVTELNWEELIPKDWNPSNPLDKLSDGQLSQLSDSSPEAANLLAEINQMWKNAPVVEELNGKVVRLPGYVVPLEFDSTQVSEFLLVPYFGACIHVPPPPSNQIVYVKTQEKLAIRGMFDTVWVTGKLKTTRANSALAEAGYTMEAYKIIPYE